MKTVIEQSINTRKNWFKNWFESEFYQKLYAHRNEKEAADFVVEIINELQPSPKAYMPDLGCGSGRHAKQLASKGFNVLGLDLAFSRIQHARQWETEALRFYRHDMREPFGTNAFDYIFNFFTSFGYFNTKEENNCVMNNISRALKMNAFVLIDYMNSERAEKCLVPEERKEIDGIIYHISRWIEKNHIHKKIEIDSASNMPPFTYTERVMKLTKNDFNVMFEKNGLRLKKAYGDYNLNDYDPKSSPRLILLAQKMH